MHIAHLDRRMPSNGNIVPSARCSGPRPASHCRAELQIAYLIRNLLFAAARQAIAIAMTSLWPGHGKLRLHTVSSNGTSEVPGLGHRSANRVLPRWTAGSI